MCPDSADRQQVGVKGLQDQLAVMFTVTAALLEVVVLERSCGGCDAEQADVLGDHSSHMCGFTRPQLLLPATLFSSLALQLLGRSAF
jgi:hypothetical protein